MTLRNLAMALLITFVLAAGVGLHNYESARNAIVVHQLSDQLDQTKSELVDATTQLSEANKKLGFLESSKARVQVTAYALTDDFGPDPVFSNNAPARSAYAVPKHTLPAEKVLNVALSPMAERTLQANLNDTIVLMSRSGSTSHALLIAQHKARLVLSWISYLRMLMKPASGGGDHSMQSTFLGRIPHFSGSNDLHGSPRGGVRERQQAQEQQQSQATENASHGIQTRPNGE